MRCDSVWRLWVGDIGQTDIASLSLALDESFPSVTALSDNVFSVFLVLALAAEGELVLWLSVWDLVDSEPFVGSSEKTGKMSFDILDIIELGGQGVVYIDDNDLPISLFLIEESHDAKNLYLFDLTSVTNELTNLANIEWVIVTFGLGLRMDDIRVFPSLLGVNFDLVILSFEHTLGKAP